VSRGAGEAGKSGPAQRARRAAADLRPVASRHLRTRALLHGHQLAPGARSPLRSLDAPTHDKRGGFVVDFVVAEVACIYNDCRGSAFTTSPWRSKHAATHACGFIDAADAHWLHVAPGESSAAACARTAAYVARSGRRATGRRTGPGAHHRGHRGAAYTCVAIGIGDDVPRGGAHHCAPMPAGSASRFAISAIVHYHAA